MNESDYRQARAGLFQAVRRQELDVAKAIRHLIVYFYKPIDKETNASVQDLPPDPRLDGR